MAKIIVAGLGPGDINYLPEKTIKLIRKVCKVYLRTAKHPLVDELLSQGISFSSFDDIYDKSSSFEEVYETIVDTILLEAEKSDVLYAVPGHPLVGERTVQMLIQAAGDTHDLEIIPAMSCLDALYAALRIDPTQGLVIADCLDLAGSAKLTVDTKKPMLCTQLYSKRIASEVKLTLVQYYPDDHPVMVVRAAGVPGQERVEKMSLYEIDRHEWVDYLTSLFVPEQKSKQEINDPFNRLIDIMDKLRQPGGCPWDLEQDFESLKRYLIEETYEVIESVEDRDMHKLEEELGDLLLQVVFYSQIARENGFFDINGVIQGISEKLIRRHPHVFGEGVEVNCVDDVNVNWEKIKHSEKENRPRFDIPRGLPALLRAEKVQKKAAEAGFDWPDIKGAWAKIYEELDELDSAVQNKNNGPEVIIEVGDLLFAIVNTARFLQVDPEEALTRTIDKFIKRFTYIENVARQQGKTPEEMSLEQMDKLWNKAKEISENC